MPSRHTRRRRTTSVPAARPEAHPQPPAEPTAPATGGSGWYAAWGKRLLDCALVAVLLPAAILAVAAAAVAVRLTSAGPAFYRQTRVGRGGRRFTMWKLRTMRHRCEAGSGACWSPPGDSRVTRVGRLLRATHLDELPQLWHVLCGDMSLVGPRPERPEIIAAMRLAEEVPGYAGRLAVRPGITGLAQLWLPPDTDIEGVRRTVAYDLWYAVNCGPWHDLRVLLATALKPLGGPGLLRFLGLTGPVGVCAPTPEVDGKWREELAGLLAAPPAPVPVPVEQPDPRAGVRAWFLATALPAARELAAELRQHGRRVRVSMPGPEEAWVRVWDRPWGWSGRRELDLKLRVRGGAGGPRVYARVLVRDGRHEFVHEHPVDRPVAELGREEVIAFVVGLYRAGVAAAPHPDGHAAAAPR